MSVFYNPIQRRLFLAGLGKSLLALPLLPSLLPRKARADAIAIPPRFVALSSVNGAQRNQDWYPKMIEGRRIKLYDKVGTGQFQAPDHFINIGKIGHSDQGLSPIFDHKFNPYIAKMNFVQGLDLRYYYTANHLGGPGIGNIKCADRQQNRDLEEMPTIDQVMAFSEGFYPDGGLAHQRSIYINLSSQEDEGMSYGWQNPFARQGPIVPTPAYRNAKLLFLDIFPDIGASNRSPASHTPIIDSVLQDYKSVIQGRRLSQKDKELLQAHVDLLAQLESKLNVRINTANCEKPGEPDSTLGQTWSAPDYDQLKKDHQIMNDVLVAAFRCQRSRIATLYIALAKGVPNPHIDANTRGTWHWASHMSTQTVGQEILRDAHKWIADFILFDLIDKMDSIQEPNGKTLLDNSWVQHSAATAHLAHSSLSVPAVTFGSAGGWMKTGQYIDFRNHDGPGGGRGVLINRWWLNIMTAMGLKPSDWNMKELNVLPRRYSQDLNRGYGEWMMRDYRLDHQYNNYYIPSERDIDQLLPFVKS